MEEGAGEGGRASKHETFAVTEGRRAARSFQIPLGLPFGKHFSLSSGVIF